MTFAKLSIAALVLGASLTPALAESGDQTPTAASVYLQSIGHSNGSAMVEGRQAAPIAAAASGLTDAERYVVVHNAENDR
ncbi:MAG: hypothetical protein LWW93_09450 [Hyphomicrobiales bacterium]|nr:hypothetical protein [Hyphomicrobiales bacterium]MCE1236570.1 hypothetical protein [Hyphomicrobiales bacterium]